MPQSGWWLQLVQNAAATFLTRSSHWSHFTPALASLHWLPVKFRINYKILLITNKALHDLAPSYISHLLVPHYTPRPLSSSNLGLLSVPRSVYKTKSDCAFAVLAPTLWNSLPHSLRFTESVDRFKRLLKPTSTGSHCLFLHLLCLFYLSLPFVLSSCLSFLRSLFAFLCIVMLMYLLFGKHFGSVSKRCYINKVLLTYMTRISTSLKWTISAKHDFFCGCLQTETCRLTASVWSPAEPWSASWMYPHSAAVCRFCWFCGFCLF